MSRDTLWQLSLNTSAEAEDAVAVLVERCFDATPSTYRNETTGRHRISVFLEQRPRRAQQAALQSGLRQLRACGLRTGATRTRIRRVPREDWAESWKRHFPPLNIGKRLLLKPTWEQRKPRRGQAVVLLDPGLSFGTGHHPTTRYCLEAIVRHAGSKRGRSLLDAGTGSGILAIAGAKLGYAPVEAFDFDPESIRVARQNIALNEATSQIRLDCRDIKRLSPRGRRRDDLIVANLSHDVLARHADRLAGRLAAGGILVVAGIPDPKFALVSEALRREGLHLRGSKRDKGWRSGTFARS